MIENRRPPAAFDAGLADLVVRLAPAARQEPEALAVPKRDSDHKNMRVANDGRLVANVSDGQSSPGQNGMVPERGAKPQSATDEQKRCFVFDLLAT